MWPWRKSRGVRLDYYDEDVRRARDARIDYELRKQGYNVVEEKQKEWREKLNKTMEKEKEKEMKTYGKYFGKNEIKDIKLWKDKGAYYLDITAEFEKDDGVYEINIPKVRLGISDHGLNCIVSDHWSPSVMKVNIGGIEFAAHEGHPYGFTEKAFFAEKQLEKKVHKMTVADIEKKLGYKIEIVSEESEG